KKNLVSVLILGILILALPLGITLLQRQQNIKSRANVDPIVFSGANVEQRNGNWVSLKPQISFELTSPLGPSASRLVELRNSFLGLLEQRLVKTVYASDIGTACDPGSEGTAWYDCSPSTASTCAADACVGIAEICRNGVWQYNSPSGASGECTTQCQNCTHNSSGGTGTTPGSGTVNAGACATARQALVQMGGPFQNSTCDEIKNKVCNDPTLFVAPNATRDALCGTSGGTTPTGSAACETARQALVQMGGPFQNSTCQEITTKVCNDPTLFVAPNATRDALCGTSGGTGGSSGSCSSLGANSAGTVTGSVASCIASKMSGAIDYIKSQGHSACSNEQIVNYMCNGGVSSANQSECLNNKSSCSGGGGTTPTGSAACETARQALVQMGGPFQNSTCQEITTKVCNDPTLFVAPSSIRDALCGTSGGTTPGGGTSVVTKCGDTPWATIDSELRSAGYGGPFDHSSTELNVYNGVKVCDGGNTTPTDSAACATARQVLVQMGGPFQTSTCDEIKNKVCNDPTLFVAPNATRDALCGTSTPASATCNSFLPNGLSDSGQVGQGGIKIFTTSDYRGGRRLLDISRTPASSTIQPSFTKTPNSASDLVFEPATDGSGNYLVNIPDNNSTTADSEYTLSASISSGNTSINCIPFVIRVPKKAADTACSADISSTEARLKINNQAWTTSGTIDLGDSVSAAGFHNNQTDYFANDIVLIATGPEGPQSHIVTLNNNNNNVTYTPDLPGKYTVTVMVTGKTGQNCTGTASLTVNAAKVTTKSYRIAENPADLATAAWKDYSADGMVVDYDFKTSGQKFIFVQFKDSSGKVTTLSDCPKCQARIKVLGEDPKITSCALSFEGNNTIVNLVGRNFGSDKGVVKSNDSDLPVKQWRDDGIQIVWPNAPTGEGLDLSVINPDGQSGQGQCSALSQVALGAKVMCRAPSSYQTNNVDLQIAGAFEGGKVVKQKVSIDQEGIIQGFNQKLEEGKQYVLSVKAPKTLRRNVVFTAQNATTNIPDFVLPVGDIFPVGNGDGKINSFDHDALVRQWNISGDATGRSADFNQDGKVNSLDWSCMRSSMLDSAKNGDDPEPVAGLAALSKIASPSSSLNSNAGSCECDLGNVVSNDCITSKTATCNGKFSCVCR
ncbi:dockerin type I domain-containing protein, partial [Patescibacteria group bacterium]|nr:dockerin type I domain-containing protein [Patescibacteria group bacterium]